MPGAATQSGIWGQPIQVRSVTTNRYNSDTSTADTIQIMRRYAYQYCRDPLVLQATYEALSRGVSGDRATACAIFYWVRGNIQFVEDETLLYQELGVAPAELDKELLIPPPMLLAMPHPMGDCDDFSLLLASMLLCAGVWPGWVTVAADPEEQRRFSHIYVCAYLADEDDYLVLDAGNRYVGIPPGWESPRVSRKAGWVV